MARKVKALRKIIGVLVGDSGDGEIVDVLVRENQGVADHIDAIANAVSTDIGKIGKQLDDLDTRLKALEGNG